MTLAARIASLVRTLAFDLTPLRVSRDYRLVYVGQSVSFLGSMVTYVAVPYQMYALTHSTLAVGLLGAAELVPLLATALVGGALADAYDRRRLVLLAEAGMALGCLLLGLNAHAAHPSVRGGVGTVAIRGARLATGSGRSALPGRSNLLAAFSSRDSDRRIGAGGPSLPAQQPCGHRALGL